MKSIAIKLVVVSVLGLLFVGCGTASKSASSITGGAPSYKFSNTGMSRTKAGDLELAAAVLDGVGYLVTSFANSDIGKSIANSDLVVYGFDGFDKNGYHKDTGTLYNKKGFDKDGYNKDGYNKDSYTKDGFGRNGINRLTLTNYDEDGYDKDGYDKDNYDIYGFDRSGINKDTLTNYDEDGYNRYKVNKNGVALENYYFYPTSEEDCYRRGLSPMNAANGSLMCHKELLANSGKSTIADNLQSHIHKCSMKSISSCNKVAGVYTKAKQCDMSLLYYNKACSYGDGGSCFQVGGLYEEGLKIIKDLKKAKEYYKKACKLGYTYGCLQ
ncbi:MAG: hypothetical protein U9R39_00360 [Campylobacterota bacterium]|nr:hypothetical protein [Campylobacterota bacterium]